MRIRRAVVPVVLALVAATGGGTVPASANAAAATAPYVDPSGITILPALPVAGSQLPDGAALALDAAESQGQSDPDNLSFPWFDRATNEVVVTAATAVGFAKAASFDPVAAARPMPKPTGQHAAVAPFTQHRAASVTHSRRYLQKIMDETIGGTVIANFPDPQTNRVLLEVTQAPATFLSSLAAKYDASAIEVVVVANPPVIRPQTRDSDASPFWGGANINAPAGSCTDAWPWLDSSNYYMITAGHCGPNGGSVSTPFESMGWINAWESTWMAGVGTVLIAECCTSTHDFRGDLSLIRVNGGLQSGAAMYIGGPGAANYLTVREMWSRSPQVGDQYCTGGAYSGELCGWVTQAVRGNITYVDGTVARNVSWGTKSGSCTIPGDSGGPVYTVRWDGTIAAKGIHSGGGGSCLEIYSDIWDAYWTYPGWLNTA